MLIRLIPATAGYVEFDGADVLRLDARALRDVRRGMQIVFQDPFGALNPRMSVEETVLEPLLIHGTRRGPEARAAVGKMLEMVGLPESARLRFPHEFSGGQRQRIGIARALILRPKLVVLDEPVSALDVSVQAQIVNLLSDLQAELGLTYLFIAHDLGVVKHISTRVAVMYLGKVVEVGEKRALYAAPKHPYTQALMASVPVTHPSLRKARTAGAAGGGYPDGAGASAGVPVPYTVSACDGCVPDAGTGNARGGAGSPGGVSFAARVNRHGEPGAVWVTVCTQGCQGRQVCGCSRNQDHTSFPFVSARVKTSGRRYEGCVLRIDVLRRLFANDTE